MRITIAAILFFLPVLANWAVFYRLSAYRRDGQGLAGSLMTFGVRIFRPDLYTDEGQNLLRWAWALLLISIPWSVGVALLLG